MPTGHADRLLPALRRVVRDRQTADRTDGQLVTAFVHDGDPDAFAGLVRRHGPMVLGVCRRVVGDAHAAEDAFQAVFLVLARRAGAVRPREQLGNWLYGVAYRTAIKARVVLARRRSREKQVEVMPEPPAPPPADPWVDLHPVIDEELARLPDRLRLPVVLCDLEGRTQRAVATQLGVAPATLATRLASARRLLAGRLSRRGVTLSGGALAGVLGQRASAGVVAPGLADAAVKAAEAVAAGVGVTGVVSAQAVQLCEGVMRMMLLSKLKAAGASALAVLTLTGGLGFGLVPARAGDDSGTAPTAPTRGADAPRSAKSAEPVDDATFLRRLCLDLTGTLPTPVETGYFVADRDANKRQKVVDWLLTDDAVRTYLAKKLGVPAERVRVVWAADAATGRVIRLAVARMEKGHSVRSTAVSAHAFSPAGKALALVAPPKGQEGKPTALAFSPNGKVLFGDFDTDGSPDVLFATLAAPDGFLFLDLPEIGANPGGAGPGVFVVNERNFDVTTGRANLNRLWARNAVRPDLRVAGGSDPPGVEVWKSVQLNDPQPAPGQLWMVVGDSDAGAGMLRLWVADPQPAAGHFVARLVLAEESDEAFLGRAAEQARGTPPTAVEKKYFLEDKDPKKREKLLDLLLKDPAVAKKLGDDWKKKMLEPPAAAALDTYQGYTLVRRPVYDLHESRIWSGVVETVPASQPDRWGQLVEELLGAKKTDEQMLEAVTLAAVGRLPTAEEKRVTLAVVVTAQDRKAAWAGLAKALAASDEGKKHAGPANPPVTTPPVPPAKP